MTDSLSRQGLSSFHHGGQEENMTETTITPERLESDSAESDVEALDQASRVPAPTGVDIGDYHFWMCHCKGEALSSRSQLNAFFELPYRKFTQDFLDRNQISYVQDEGSLLIVGDEAGTFAAIMNADSRRPMREGFINPSEPKALWVIRKISELLIDQPENLGDTLCLTIPSVSSAMESRLVYQEAVLKDLFMGMGYRVRTVHKGHATVLASLENNQFNGIGINLGAGMCNGCLSYLSVPVITFGYSKGGDYIDQSVAAVTDMSLTDVRLAKEAELDLSRRPTNRTETALQIFYDEVIRGLLDRLSKVFVGSSNLPKIHKPMPLVLGGGTVMAKGFLARFQKIFGEFSFPIPISEIALVEDPLTAAARGAYLAAVAEEIPSFPQF
jgi:hypothetical protein